MLIAFHREINLKYLISYIPMKGKQCTVIISGYFKSVSFKGRLLFKAFKSSCLIYKRKQIIMDVRFQLGINSSEQFRLCNKYLQQKHSCYDFNLSSCVWCQTNEEWIILGFLKWTNVTFYCEQRFILILVL